MGIIKEKEVNTQEIQRYEALEKINECLESSSIEELASILDHLLEIGFDIRMP